ncbi:alginate lyase [Pseudomonas brassicacearum]|uniref:polysaccharide lyase family 7 protein n=1 Tax=Pseudomonas brassicacearum TaxID=930166 RepID=UPI00042EDE6D|nr:polysaccharide lyase family 7 protein [Pseudomonas brassicacearum]AHL34422.1 alginate lyase [Pseudomonas brassicacearum]
MIDLSSWNLTIPEGAPAKVIETPRLVKGYSDKYFRSGNTLFFWAPVTGSTTSKSEFPRSELRETYRDGRLRNWTYPEAEHRLSASLIVNQMPSEGRIVIGQIHIYQGKGPLLKVEYLYDPPKKTGRVVVNYRLKPNSADRTVVIAEGVDLKQKLSYEVRLSPAGYLKVSAQGNQWGKQLSSSWKNKLLYFKAGAYALDNTGYKSEGAQVTFSRLEVGHRTR